MSSPSSSPIELRAKNSQSISGMSTSLRERLKKSGRYHPGNSLLGSSPNSIKTNDNNVDVQVCEACPIKQQDGETPKRKSSETLCNAVVKNSTDIIKRRKIEYSESTLDKTSIICHQFEVGQQSSSTSPNLGIDSKIESVKEHGAETNINMLSNVGSNHRLNDESADTNRSDLHISNSSPDQNYANLKDLQLLLEKELKLKEEQIRKLKMVKMYSEKNNLTELQVLINTWREVSQRAIADLHDLQPPPKPSMTDLINHLQIDHDLIHYVVDEETFT